MFCLYACHTGSCNFLDKRATAHVCKKICTCCVCYIHIWVCVCPVMFSLPSTCGLTCDDWMGACLTCDSFPRRCTQIVRFSSNSRCPARETITARSGETKARQNSVCTFTSFLILVSPANFTQTGSNSRRAQAGIKLSINLQMNFNVVLNFLLLLIKTFQNYGNSEKFYKSNSFLRAFHLLSHKCR